MEGILLSTSHCLWVVAGDLWSVEEDEVPEKESQRSHVHRACPYLFSSWRDDMTSRLPVCLLPSLPIKSKTEIVMQGQLRIAVGTRAANRLNHFCLVGM